MLACLPASGDPTSRLLSRTQMNTGLQKWETTQKMRSVSYPTPAELDAYAKKVANNPLTIQIFPNSVKVPQRKHIRRTVNGLDTSSSSQRHSPYPSQVSASRGLLAVLRAPAKGVIKQSDGSRARQLHKATMNPHNGPYATQSTLNLPQPAPHLQGPSQAAQKQGMVHPQVLQHQQSMTHPMTIQQPQTMPHPQALQQRNMAHSQPMQRQQSLSQHTQGLVGSQPLPQAVGAGPPAMPNSLQQPPPGAYGPRKLPDADAPPNVTVSTSTIPLSMAASLHQNRPSDLSSIVHQINQLCQARAGMGTTSVCEGQIANPSPISRNLLINASSRVSSHHPAMGPVSSCLMVGHLDKATAQTASAALHLQPNIAATISIPSFHSDPEKQLQQQRSWAQHQLAHMQQPPEGAHPCKNPRMEAPTECAFPSRNLNYPHKLPNTAQSFPLKHPAEKSRPSSPVNCPVGPMPYINSHYMPPSWGTIPATAGNNGSGPQDLPVTYQGGQAAASVDRIPGAKYRPGKEGPSGQPKLMQNVDFLGGEFQIPSFQEQNLDVMEKLHRSAMGQVQEPSNGGSVHTHHPGYR
ncbi:putative protein FAM222B-like [Scophthalmus maximus]|uniref:Protein FAM222B n=1 Tax=Scophthalmus maximus TaxID=52904 RepID=A0A2U9B3K9_SCOMX|nr:putative protein FAM222B-like [Scophthalmus maximus]